jgi:hypothetical protein
MDRLIACQADESVIAEWRNLVAMEIRPPEEDDW